MLQRCRVWKFGIHEYMRKEAMTLFRNLVAEMARYDIKSKDLAECLGCSERTIFSKVHEKMAISFFDALKIRDTFFPDLKLEYLFQQYED